MTIARRIAVIAAALGLFTPSAALAADNQLLLVHGHGPAAEGTNCGSIWGEALEYYESAGGRERSSMTTIGYYSGDRGRCDAMIGDGNAGNDRPIQDLARDLALYIDSRHAPVDVIAHSMGGLIVRVALLGSAQGWDGFPKGKLDVDNVVTLSTPHRGVANPGAHDDPQWRQMNPDSAFIRRLHESGSGLGDGWADRTDWTLVGSHEDATVAYASGIDKGANADQKFGYRDADDAGKVTHTGIRTLHGRNAFSLTYWHAAGNHGPHRTDRGWSPLKAAFQAATHDGDNLPK